MVNLCAEYAGTFYLVNGQRHGDVTAIFVMTFHCRTGQDENQELSAQWPSIALSRFRCLKG